MGTPFSSISLSNSQYISAPHHSRIDFAVEPFCVNIRFKGTAVGPIANKFSTKGWMLETVAGGAVRGTLNASTITSSGTPDVLDGEWHDIEFSRDVGNDRLLLFVDGGIKTITINETTSANGGNVQLARTPSGSSTLTCSLGEFRISSGLRHGDTFTPPAWQFEDDGNTRLLWHFNEGKGSTIFDSSADATDITDSGTRQNGSISGGSGTWAYGPLLANPARIVHEALWYGLDTFSIFTTYANAYELRRHRCRQTDESTRRIMTNGLTPADMPGIWLYPESVSGVPPETNAYNEATIPMTIIGGIYKSSAFSAQDLWWVTMRAIHALEITDAGAFLHYRVNNWRINRTGFFTTTDERGNLISRFVSEMLFTVRCDIRTAGTP